MQKLLKFTPAVNELECVHQGKVRDTFAIPGMSNLLLVVATDRVSTHNKVHLSEIQYKGQSLTALTVFWMGYVFGNMDTQLEAFGGEIYNYLPKGDYPADFHLRAIIVKKLEMIPVEFIFRDRMAGSLLKDYYSKGIQNPYGIKLDEGLELMSPFWSAIFTPTDKSETDDPLPAAKVVSMYPDAYNLARSIYCKGREVAARNGIEIIDGKLEIGIDPNTKEVVLADECLTPDSCRFVKAGTIEVGKEPAWMDKQYLREEAECIWAGGEKSPLQFSEEVCSQTSARYLEIFQALTGHSLGDFQKNIMFIK